MLIRVITSVIGVPFVIWLMMSGGIVLQTAGAIVAIIGLDEYYKTLQKKYNPMYLVGMISAIIYFLNFEFMFSNYNIYVASLLIVSLVVMVFKYPKYNILDVVLTLFGIIYVVGLLSFLLGLRGMDDTGFLVGLVFICAWGSDTSAYFAGRYLGKHKLAPVLSPKKTVEGSIGGAIGAGALAYGYIMVLGSYQSPVVLENKWLLVMIVIVAALLSQIGDLAASAIKRFMEQKDFGSLLPGHGGVLDRFDSILMVAPFMYIIFYLYIEILI